MDPLVSVVVARYAATKRIDLTWVEGLRKDFLTLLKNLPRVKDYKTAHELRDAVRVYRNNFDELFFENFLNKLKDKKQDENSGWINSYWEGKLRTVAWSFSSELSVPIGFSDDYHSEAGRFDAFLKDFPAWKTRVQRKGAAFWKEMKEVLDELARQGKPAIDVEVPTIENATLEGFKLVMKGFNPDDAYNQKELEVFKEGLRLYRRRAGAVAPILLKRQLPVECEFKSTLDKGGEYHHAGYISFYMSSIISKGVPWVAHVMAHEMGHHLWRTVLSSEAQDFWYQTIKGDYGDLDIKELLDKWPGDSWAFDFPRVMGDTDPILALQVDAVSQDSRLLSGRQELQSKEDFQKLYDSGQKTLPVPKTPITGYANKNPEEAFCETIGMLIAYGPKAVHERVRMWLDTAMPGSVKVATLEEQVVRRFKAATEGGGYWDEAVTDLNKFNSLYAQVEKKPQDAAVLRKCVNGTNKLIKLAIWAGKCLTKSVDTTLTTARREIARLAKDKEAPAEELLNAIHQFKKAVQEMLDSTAPENFTYQGFKVTNEQHLSDELCRKALEGVDFLKALFKKRGVQNLIEQGIARIVLVLDAGASAFFHSGTREMTLSVGEFSKGNVGRFLDTTFAGETVLHEFGHYVHRNYITGEAAEAWDAPWEGLSTEADKNPFLRGRDPKRNEQLDPLEIVTEYGKVDKYEDFAETFMIFMAAPEKLTPTSKFRMQRALSLSGLYGKPVLKFATKDLLASVVERFKAGLVRFAEQDEAIRDEGGFIVHYSPQIDPAVVEDISTKVHSAIGQCRSAGLSIKDKLRIELRPVGSGSHTLAYYSFGSNPPTLGITSKSYKRADLVTSLIHELGHYIHDKVVPGGKSNVEIQSRYSWAVGEVQAPRPRKGVAFEFQYRGGLLNYSHSNKPYLVTGEIIGKGRGTNVRVVILKYPSEILDDPKLGLAFRGSDGQPMKHPIVELDLDKLLYRGKQTDKEDHSYEGHQHDWVPTTYSKKSSSEWFAELVATFVLKHLPEAPSAWLLSVIKTGT